jgi:hypothetical protein
LCLKSIPQAHVVEFVVVGQDVSHESEEDPGTQLPYSLEQSETTFPEMEEDQESSELLAGDGGTVSVPQSF